MGLWVSGKWSVDQWVGGQWSVVLIKSKINVCFCLEVYISKSKVIIQFPCSRNVMVFLSQSKLFLHFWRSLLIFLDHFYCFTLREQCTSTKLFLVGIFPKNKNSLFVHFSRSVNSNNLPYLPEIEIKLQIALIEINHKWANLVLSLRFSKQLAPSIMAKL